MMRRLSPLQAYRLGYLRGLNRAQAVMRSKVDQWEAEIVALQDDYEVLISDLRCVRDERAIEEAVSERVMHSDRWLHEGAYSLTHRSQQHFGCPKNTRHCCRSGV